MGTAKQLDTLLYQQKHQQKSTLHWFESYWSIETTQLGVEPHIAGCRPSRIWAVHRDEKMTLDTASCCP
ncbi:protein of unknown function [Burkholderia multivorans]